jgi:hypothetical protein
LKTHRISTTISQKHWELLKKHVEKFETQQKVLEHALECLENGSKQDTALTEEEKLWLRFKWANSVVIVEKDGFKTLLETADIELLNKYFTRNKPIQWLIEYYWQKSLKECNLKEVIDALVINFRMSNWFNTIDYTDDVDYYTLRITHSLGFNASKLTEMPFVSMFETYGVKVDSLISEKTVFMKIFKN